MPFSSFVFYLGTSIIIGAFCIAGLIFKRHHLPIEYKFILGFICSGILVSINSALVKYGWHPFAKDISLIQGLLYLPQYGLLCNFFLIILKQNKRIKAAKKLYAITFGLLICITIILSFVRTPFHVQVTGNITLIIFCIFYFDELLDDSNHSAITDSRLWIVSGMFLHCCISLPIYGLIEFEYVNMSSVFRKNLFSISNLSLISFYLCIIKSFLLLNSKLNAAERFELAKLI